MDGDITVNIGVTENITVVDNKERQGGQAGQERPGGRGGRGGGSEIKEDKEDI